MNDATQDRCEVCGRVIRKRPNPRKRRCPDCLNVVPLFPVSAVKPSRRAKGGAR